MHLPVLKAIFEPDRTFLIELDDRPHVFLGIQIAYSGEIRHEPTHHLSISSRSVVWATVVHDPLVLASGRRDADLDWG